MIIHHGMMNDSTPIPIPDTIKAKDEQPKILRNYISIKSIKKNVDNVGLDTKPSKSYRKKDDKLEPLSDTRNRRQVTYGPLKAGWYASSGDRNYSIDPEVEDESDCDNDGVESDDSESAYFDDFSISSISSNCTSASSPSYQGDYAFSIPKKSPTDSSVSQVSTFSFQTDLSQKAQSQIPLTRLLNNVMASNSRKPNLRSNLTKSFKTFTNAFKKRYHDISVYTMSPRATDDALPHSSSTSRFIEPQGSIEDPKMEELTTFSSSQDEKSLSEPVNLTCFKNRDQRVNSVFLRLYALDYNARIQGTLPNNYSASEINRLVENRPCLRKFDNHHGLHRISDMSREKLWNNIVLPPRSDLSPLTSVNPKNYIYIGDPENTSTKNSSIITSRGTYFSWYSKKQSFRPAGALENFKVIENGVSPSSSVTRTQFTSRKWCNPRWIDHNQDCNKRNKA